MIADTWEGCVSATSVQASSSSASDATALSGSPSSANSHGLSTLRRPSVAIAVVGYSSSMVDRFADPLLSLSVVDVRFSGFAIGGEPVSSGRFIVERLEPFRRWM